MTYIIKSDQFAFPVTVNYSDLSTDSCPNHDQPLGHNMTEPDCDCSAYPLTAEFSLRLYSNADLHNPANYGNYANCENENINNNCDSQLTAITALHSIQPRIYFSHFDQSFCLAHFATDFQQKVLEQLNDLTF
jgi:hypothetical protein